MTSFEPLLIAQAFLVPLLSPLLIGLIRKVKARFQNRVGGPIVQPYRDLWKLFHKNEVISNDASWVSTISPFVVFVIPLVISLSVPLITFGSALAGIADILVMIYLFALGVFFLALNGLDVGGAFGGLGSSREMTLAACAEGAFLFSLFFLAIASGTTNLVGIISGAGHFTALGSAPLLLSAIAFFVVLISENARIPFDNPATHLELTMVHEAMIIENSGKSLALLEWGSWMKLFLFLAILSNAFFPWGIAPLGSGFFALLGSLIIFLFKISALALVIAIIESSMAKMRYFRLPDILFGAMILALIGIAIALH